MTGPRVAVRGAIRVALILGVIVGSMSGPHAARATDACVTQQPAGRDYRVVLCINTPTAGAAVSGLTPVTASATVEGAQLAVRSVVFYLDDAYLITDFELPYEFVLPTNRFVDGAHQLAFEVTLRDDFLTTRATVSIEFDNGVSTPPVNTNHFAPRQPPSVPGRPYVVAAVGDGAGGEATAKRVTDLIAGWDPTMMLYLGDVYERGTPTEFLNWYGGSDAFYGRFREITNPTVGDHEFKLGRGPGYFDYWDNVPGYYSFNAAGWHFASLDSTGQSGGTDHESAQYRWLAKDLQAHAGQCTIVYFQNPVYSIGPHGDTAAMRTIWSLLVAKGVTLVLSGDDHDYQRWQPLGPYGSPMDGAPVQMVVGTGGHSIRAFAGDDPRMVAGFDDPHQAYGAVRLQLGAGGLAFAFENIAGVVLDEGALACPNHATDAGAPASPANLTGVARSSSRIQLDWSAASDDIVVTGYLIMRDGVEIGRTDSMTTTYEDRSLAPGHAYTYSVQAVDMAANRSAVASLTSSTLARPTVRPIASVPLVTAPNDDSPGSQGMPVWLLVGGAGLLAALGATRLRDRSRNRARG